MGWTKLSKKCAVIYFNYHNFCSQSIKKGTKTMNINSFLSKRYLLQRRKEPAYLEPKDKSEAIPKENKTLKTAAAFNAAAVCNSLY